MSRPNRRARRGAGLLAPFALAACGAPSPQPAASPTPPPLSGDAAKVAALTPKLRAGVLMRAVIDAGQPCQRVVDEQRADAAGGGAVTWVATCDDGHRWVIAIAPDGSAKVTDAKAIARLR